MMIAMFCDISHHMIEKEINAQDMNKNVVTYRAGLNFTHDC